MMKIHAALLVLVGSSFLATASSPAVAESSEAVRSSIGAQGAFVIDVAFRGGGVRRGGVAVGPRGGAVVHRGGAYVGPRGGVVAHSRTAVVGPRGGVAVRGGTAVVGPRGGVAARGGAAVVGPRGGAVVRGGGVAWARPSTYWWRPGRAIAAGAAIGFVTATVATWAGAPPAPGYCWYYTDASRQQGFWDACP